MRPAIRLFAPLLAVLAWCAGGSDRAVAQGPYLPHPYAPPVQVGSLTLAHCEKVYDGLCGSLVRPIDPEGRVSGSITVGFELYRHTDQSQPQLGTIAAQEGGPGYATTGSRDGYVRLFAPLRDRRDILLIDKRGTGKSGAIDCPALQKGLKGGPFGLAAVRACGWQLGKTAWLYSSTYAADDMAAVLQALATGPVDYYGDSYGTFFGQVFAARHPDLVRTLVLDSAYPTLGGTPYFSTEIENGPIALERVCARSPACAALPTSVTERFQALLARLRAHPVSGMAPGINGALRHVKADAGALFLVIYNVGNNLVAYRDLDAGGRAYLESGDALPLLRLVAEAEAGNASGGAATAFSYGLSDAVLCADYHQLFDMRAPFGSRRDQLVRSLAAKQASDPDVYTPFTLAEAMGAPQDPESLDTCSEWPAAPEWARPGAPVSPGTAFPKVPVLVLSGELDTVTSPKEGAETTALFPEAWFVVVRNAGHETAIGDGGVYIPPYGSDLTRCVGPIVLNFVATGGDPGDTSCALHGRPIRTVSAFVRHWREVPPAEALSGNAADPEQLRLASAAAETVGDALARYYVTLSGTDLGLRGGRFHLSPTPRGYTLHLDRLRWTQDLAITGTLDWDQLDGAIEAHVAVTADGHSGTLKIVWNDRQTNAQALLTGEIDGQAVQAQRTAP